MSGESKPLGAREGFLRTFEFWTRSTSIYLSYKVCQLQELGLRMAGRNQQAIQAHWDKHHDRAAQHMYQLCVDLRGFYLKTGQFVGARGDFVPEQICRRLSLLQDQVPPMTAQHAQQVIEDELGMPLEHAFEWIDLDQPLGSASISQVHKAKLRCRHTIPPELDASLRGGYRGLDPFRNPPADVDAACRGGPRDGVVAVKVQYPEALSTMSLDLSNIRLFAAFLAKTEIKFDLVSAVDELAAQIRLEFDFRREARIMDAVAHQFRKQTHKIEVPRSVPGMVTDRLLVMNFLDGVPITRLKDHTKNLSEKTRRMAARRILSRVSEAYGRMVLLDGLFQADGHPGNILVMKGGKIGLIDYGQSKRLPDRYRKAFARLVLALEGGDEQEISRELAQVGVKTGGDDVSIRAKMAYGMFDTRGKVDPFDPDSPIKQMAISHFPPDMFFVLRVTQLLRGLAKGMGVAEFSTASQLPSCTYHWRLGEQQGEPPHPTPRPPAHRTSCCLLVFGLHGASSALGVLSGGGGGGTCRQVPAGGRDVPHLYCSSARCTWPVPRQLAPEVHLPDGLPPP